ncbi:hypothetical protein [Candidatus Poriferisodalis sp.]|uniref:hypothetical protein n=1 Tax=Candidatus Poriferisodalis sp. TaxID=3101277 RepID=UPI003B02508E
MTDPADTPRSQSERGSSAVLTMLDSLPRDWNGPGSLMPNESCVERALEVEVALGLQNLSLWVVPMPEGGISISWTADGTRSVLNIENDDPDMEYYTAREFGGQVRDYAEISDAGD